MKKMLLLSTLLGVSIHAYSEIITVYAPESMKWIEEELKADFKAKTGDEIKFVGMKDIPARLKLEKNNPKSDVVLGLTGVSGERAKSENLLAKYTSTNEKLIVRNEFKMDKDGYLTAFDYGLMGINYNLSKLKTPPKTFEEMKSMSKSLIVQDPRSSTGQEVMLWSIAVYGDKWKDFWKSMKPAILTTSADWDDAFAKFSSGEGSMMTGFATSNAYFYAEKTPKFDTFIPAEGGYVYLEGAAITNRKDIKNGSKKFVDYLLTPEVQEKIVKNNYMLPVTNIKLNNEFAKIPTANKVVTLDPKVVMKNLETWKKEFLAILQSK